MNGYCLFDNEYTDFYNWFSKSNGIRYQEETAEQFHSITNTWRKKMAVVFPGVFLSAQRPPACKVRVFLRVDDRYFNSPSRITRIRRVFQSLQIVDIENS